MHICGLTATSIQPTEPEIVERSMRQRLKDRRKQIREGMPVPRLLTMVLMLAIMGMLFVQLRNPSTWQWFASDKDDAVVAANDSTTEKNLSPTPFAAMATSARTVAKTEKQAAPPGSKENPGDSAKASVASSPATADELTPSGPTDLDSLEQEGIQQAISIINDGSTEMTRLDMPACFQILDWVDHQSTALLRKRAKRDVYYSEFRKNPAAMRLQIVELNLHVLQIVRLDMPPKNGVTEPMTTREGHPIYEVRGFTQEGGSNLYFGIVTDLPSGLPIGTSIDHYAKLVGYFYKLQGYVSQAQQLEAEKTRKRPTPLKAPVIIGRLVWTAPPKVAQESFPVWIFATVGSVAVAIIVLWVWWSARGSRVRGPSAPSFTIDSHDEAPTVGNWLDQAQSGRVTLEPESTTSSDGASINDGFRQQFSGNIPWESGDSSNGHGKSGRGVFDGGSPGGE
jgi:hypothetical protein